LKLLERSSSLQRGFELGEERFFYEGLEDDFFLLVTVDYVKDVDRYFLFLNILK